MPNPSTPKDNHEDAKETSPDTHELKHRYNLLGYLWGGTSALVTHPTRRNSKIQMLSKPKEVPANGFRGMDRSREIEDLLLMIERSDDVEQLENVEELARNLQMPDGSLDQFCNLPHQIKAQLKKKTGQF